MTVTDDTLALPRILCLHGAGTSKAIFELQCRGLSYSLRSSFRFVFVDAPFESLPHPSIAAFGDLGPFRRWQRWNVGDPEVEGKEVGDRIYGCIEEAMQQDQGQGDCIAVLGFSQGAKMAASLLWAQQRAAETGQGPRTAFRFGIIIAGSPPVVGLDSRLSPVAGVADAGLLTSTKIDLPASSDGEHVIRIPTLHVHGLADPAVTAHRQLLGKYGKPETTRLYEWSGDHRLPLKPQHVNPLADEIVKMAREACQGIKVRQPHSLGLP